jgi:hypothetical protein
LDLVKGAQRPSYCFYSIHFLGEAFEHSAKQKQGHSTERKGREALSVLFARIWAA